MPELGIDRGSVALVEGDMLNSLANDGSRLLMTFSKRSFMAIAVGLLQVVANG